MAGVVDKFEAIVADCVGGDCRVRACFGFFFGGSASFRGEQAGEHRAIAKDITAIRRNQPLRPETWGGISCNEGIFVCLDVPKLLGAIIEGSSPCTFWRLSRFCVCYRTSADFLGSLADRRYGVTLAFASVIVSNRSTGTFFRTSTPPPIQRTSMRSMRFRLPRPKCRRVP